MPETLPCPRCDRPSEFSELDKNHGVCRFCRKSEAVAKGLSRRKSPSEAEHDQQPDHPFTEHEPERQETNETKTATQFDYAEVDRMLGEMEQEHTPDAREQAGEALAAVFRWVWSDSTPKAAFNKFVALSAGLRPDLLEMKTFKELADELGVTKQLLSRHSLTFADTFGLQWSRSRNKTSRAKMKAAAMGHEYRGGMKAKANA